MRIDFDKGIELYNEKNPENKISRKDIYVNKNITKATIQNYKKGKIPRILDVIDWFLDFTELELKDILIK